MSTVICKLPNAGLGNQLFPLMHAYLFAQLNDLPVIVIGYHHLKIGPYLRREKSKRTYNQFFCFQKNITGEYLDRLRIKKLEKKAEVVMEPQVRKMDAEELRNKVFVFDEIADYDDYFGRLKDHRQEVKGILNSLVHSRIKNTLKQQEAPVIGVHIRMGDFRKLNKGEEYRSGHVRTPLEYFVNCIHAIRDLNGNNLPVTIFTDGYKEELQEILKLDNVRIIRKNPDLVDLLLLSKSKIILPTHGSTFSAWAAFLSDAPVVLPFSYQKPLREGHLYKNVYEGKFDLENEILRMNIKNIYE
jgi:hypothetical protein